MRVIPGDTMPALDARLVIDGKGGGRWLLAREKPSKLALLAFYRGIFCPICRVWLADLDRLVPEFDKRGVSVLALSCDKKDGAEKAVAAWIQSTPYARVHIAEVLTAVDNFLAKGLPEPRGSA